MKKIEESFLKLRPEVLQVSVLEFANKYSTQYHKSCSHELL